MGIKDTHTVEYIDRDGLRQTARARGLIVSAINDLFQQEQDRDLCWAILKEIPLSILRGIVDLNGEDGDMYRPECVAVLLAGKFGDNV